MSESESPDFWEIWGSILRRLFAPDFAKHFLATEGTENTEKEEMVAITKKPLEIEMLMEINGCTLEEAEETVHEVAEEIKEIARQDGVSLESAEEKWDKIEAKKYQQLIKKHIEERNKE